MHYVIVNFSQMVIDRANIAHCRLGDLEIEFETGLGELGIEFQAVDRERLG